ncbi:hypothetical protein UPYG_G00158760 [Umbra pygmaea]|uniref:Uncharacterized protein n=1 Tax=Umbra pygmaea TaxID=75934 RepID=A0ABD0XEV1_UMBPY
MKSAAGCTGTRLYVEVNSVSGYKLVCSLFHGQHSPHRLLKGNGHVSGVLGTGLIVRMVSIFQAPPPGFLCRHLPLRHIHFVPQYHEGEHLRFLHVSVVDELLLPVGQVVEALVVVHAEGEQAAV